MLTDFGLQPPIALLCSYQSSPWRTNVLICLFVTGVTACYQDHVCHCEVHFIWHFNIFCGIRNFISKLSSDISRVRVLNCDSWPPNLLYICPHFKTEDCFLVECCKSWRNVGSLAFCFLYTYSFLEGGIHRVAYISHTFLATEFVRHVMVEKLNLSHVIVMTPTTLCYLTL